MIDDWQREPPRPWRRVAIVAVAGAIVIGAGYSLYRYVSTVSLGAKKPVMEVVTLKLIQPPPPPPPPQVQKPPPEPAKMLVQPKDEAPPDKPKADKPPQNLALDAKAGPGADGFGLGGRPGGTALIGGGTGGGGSRFGSFANLLQGEIQQSLRKDEKLRNSRYGVVVALWLSPVGRLDRVKLLNSSGNHDIDQRIEQTLTAMPALSRAPPREMPQPINIRIDARSAQ